MAMAEYGSTNKSRYHYEYPRPAMTVDIVCFDLQEWQKKNVRVLLIERGGEPFKGWLALPGGYMEITETTRAAAVRELREETTLDVLPEWLSVVGLYDDPDRNPSGRVINMAYWTLNPELADLNRGKKATAADDAVKLGWYNLSDVREMEIAFDHKQIILDAYQKLIEQYGGEDKLFLCL
jgi:8-oxo-dGTP diphosphatase